MDAMLENIKMKKKLEYLSNVAKENHELKESIKRLTATVENLEVKVDMLSKQVSANYSTDNILGTLEYVLARVREYELLEDE